jgi:phosphate transport system permease protein
MSKLASTPARYRAERRFKALGLAAIAITGVFLAALLTDILMKALPAFTVSQLQIAVSLDPGKIDAANLGAGDYQGVAKQSLQTLFPDVTSRSDRKKLNALISAHAGNVLQDLVTANPSMIGTSVEVSLPLASDAELFIKGQSGASFDNEKATWLKALQDQGRITSGFNSNLFTQGDSREPESAGIKGALIGSLFIICVTLLVSLPIGVASALYLEEFAPKNRFTDLIEVNINNLAAVPSIIFGLLGLAVFLNGFGLPRSTAIVGGLVLALLVLPTIIIASRAAIRSVPPSIKEAALGVGASHQQAVFHHVLPLAIPGILTGTILAVARALGETAPLLMIGMIAFIADIPGSITDATTVLPVQVYLWSDLPEEAFKSMTAAAILILLIVLFGINALAIYLRNKFEKRW